MREDLLSRNAVVSRCQVRKKHQPSESRYRGATEYLIRSFLLGESLIQHISKMKAPIKNMTSFVLINVNKSFFDRDMYQRI